MNIKLDENLGNRAIELFREVGHEVVTVSEQNLGGATDDELIEACRTEGRVLIMLDFSNVLRFPPERYAGIAVLRGPHPIDLDTIRERVRALLKASEQEELALDRGASSDTRVRPDVSGLSQALSNKSLPHSTNAAAAPAPPACRNRIS